MTNASVMPLHSTPIIASEAEPIDLSEKATPVTTDSPPLLAISTLLDHDHTTVDNHQPLHSPAGTVENQLSQSPATRSLTSSSTSRDGSSDATPAGVAQTVGGLERSDVARTHNKVQLPRLYTSLFINNIVET